MDLWDKLGDGAEEYLNTFLENCRKIMICDECNHKNRNLINVCEKCGYEINGNNRALKLFADMSEKMVEFYMLSGISEYKAKKRVYDLLRLVSLPPEWIGFIKIRFDL